MSRLGIGALVLGAAVYGAWQGFGVQTMGDFPEHYAPALNHLLAADLGGFLAHLPADGASAWLLLSAPAALIGKLLVGGQLAIFRFAALACLLAGGGLGLYLVRDMRRAGRAPMACAAALALCVLTPVVLDAIFYGHPEEGLGAVLCVGALLLAAAGRFTPAGFALGLALINKPWALLAVAPVLLAARGGRLQVALIAGGIAGAWTGAAYLASPADFARELRAANIPLVAHPPDLWWPVAQRRIVAGLYPAYFPPRLISAHARELAVALSLPLSLPLWRRAEPSTEQCLALLAWLLLLRCALDPTNHIYYQVPFVIALIAWEVRARQAPVFSLLATGGLWLTFHTVAGLGSLDAQFACYMATMLPVAAALTRPAFGFVPRRAASLPSARLSTA